MGSPSLIDAQSTAILARLNAMLAVATKRVDGCQITDGGTTQASGAGTAPNIDFDNAFGIFTVDGTVYEEAAAADFDSTAGTGINFGATSGKEVVFAIVYNATAGALDALPGTVADSGDGEAPDDDDVDTVLGHTNWVRVANATVERTGDTTITVAVDHTVRPGVATYSQLAESEADFRL